MPIEIRQPKSHERLKVLESLTKGLRPRVEWKLEEEYPTILSSENFPNSVIALNNDQIVGHAAYYPYMIKSALGIFKVAALGQVWTHPDYRRQGIASEILKNLEQKMREEKFSFSILWTGEPSIYIKAGYLRAGREIDWIFEKADREKILTAVGEPADVVMLTPNATLKSIPKISGLHAVHPFHIKRSQKEWEAYTKVPQSQWYMTKDGSAYAVVGKGADLTNVIHEWGGSSRGLLSILCEILKSSERAFLISPDDMKEPLLNELETIGIQKAEGIVGYAQRLSLDRYTFERLVQTKKSEFFFWGFDSV